MPKPFPHAVLFEIPPEGGLNPAQCELHECFLVRPVALLHEHRVEIPHEREFFFEDIADARQDVRRWLENVTQRPGVRGAHAHIRHADVLINPASGNATTQLAGVAPIIDLMDVGTDLD